MKEVGKFPRQSEAFSLGGLNKKAGGVGLDDLTREPFIALSSDRAREEV
jgi:hypothetical protein